MEHKLLEQLRYPIGHFKYTDTVDGIIVSDWISELESLPTRLEDLVLPLSGKQLDTPYRPEGWTVRQLVHHLADSHHNTYTRFKWALTEDRPVIKAYNEKDWGDLFDSRQAPLQISLDYIRALHVKLVFLLRGLSEEELSKVYIHPNGNKEVCLMQAIGMYAWHGNHHLAHISGLIQREGW